jgi:4-hydroxy-tetrahydrodipicolinate synthase
MAHHPSQSGQSIANCSLITAMVTPFAGKNGQRLVVDHASLSRLATYLVNEQANDALLVNGTTGESPTTTLDEKLAILNTVKSAVDVPVITGAGCNNTEKSITTAVTLAKAGADGLLLVVPYYNKPSQSGMLAHFSAIAEAVNSIRPSTPMIIYNIPGRTGACMSPETMATLHSQHPTIMGVKQSHDNLDDVVAIKSQCPETFTVWSGDDPLTLPMMTHGAVGVVSVLAHVAGRSIKAMMMAKQQGDDKLAEEIHQQLLPLAKGLFELPNPTVVKTLLAAQGTLPNCHMRLPMVAMTDGEVAALIPKLQQQVAIVHDAHDKNLAVNI